MTNSTKRARLGYVTLPFGIALATAGELHAQGGEDAATASEISALPFLDTGTTVGYADDSDETCPYAGSTSPDVWYAYTPAGTGRIDIALCESDYDTKVYVYDAALSLVACNDDACSDAAGNPFRAQLQSVELTGCETYFIVIDGWSGASGDYLLQVDEAAEVCETLPPFLEDEVALTFDGQDGTHVSIGVYEELDFDPPFTVEAWVRPFSANGFTRIASTRGDDVNSGSGFGQLNGSLLFTTFGILDYVAAGATLEVGRWTHVALAFDQSYDAHFFIDGFFVQTVAGSTPQNPSTNSLDIGRNPSIDQQVWAGPLDEVRYWDHVRTAEEIAADRDRILAGDEPGLVGYWRFEEGDGDMTADLAGEHDGTVNGPTWIELEECAGPCPADVVASGEVGFQDLISLLFNWGPCPCCPEDIDGDGEVGFADLLVLLFDWGPCPVATGACCLIAGCLDLASDDCIAMGGSYEAGATCADVGCPGDDGWIVTAPVVWTGNTCTGESQCELSFSPDERWAVTIPEAGEWTISVCGAPFDTMLWLGTTPCGEDVAIADDECGIASEIQIALEARTYYLTLEGSSSGDCGTYTLLVTR